MTRGKMSIANYPQIISTNKVEEIRFSVVLSFERFSSRCSQPDSFYDSKTFSPPGRPDGPHFFLRLMPKRYYNYTNTHYAKLEFHLATPAATKSFRVYHTTTIVGRRGGKHGEKSVNSSFTTNDGKSWLLFEIFHPELCDASNGLLTDDKVTFCSKFTFYLENNTEEVLFAGMQTDQSRRRLGSTAQQQLITDLERLYGSKAFADVILEVPEKNGSGGGNHEFPVHKALLTTRSPVFAAMFEHQTTKEALEGRVVIEDVKAEVLQQLLAFLYTGAVDFGGLSQMELAEGEQQSTVQLLAAADKYQVESLKELCEEHLADGLSVQSMFPTLRIADLYSAPRLRARAVDFIARQTSIQDRVKALLNVNDSPEKMIALLQKVAQL